MYMQRSAVTWKMATPTGDAGPPCIANFSPSSASPTRNEISGMKRFFLGFGSGAISVLLIVWLIAPILHKNLEARALTAILPQSASGGGLNVDLGGTGGRTIRFSRDAAQFQFPMPKDETYSSPGIITDGLSAFFVCTAKNQTSLVRFDLHAKPLAATEPERFLTERQINQLGGLKRSALSKIQNVSSDGRHVLLEILSEIPLPRNLRVPGTRCGILRSACILV